MEYQFKIQLKGVTKPPVWRKVIVPADFTFLRFHNVIQIAFGWDDYHLFEFEYKEYQGNIRITVPPEDDFDFGVKTLDASKVKLSKIFTENTRKLLYVYDFGDNWVHEITLEAFLNDKRKEAFCLSGKGNCPPEDCGGPYGYEDMKKVFRTMPDSEEADGYRDWLELDKDEIWDTTAFNIDEINADLKQV
ncbi:plasmid pRiA4b ORF-3 family protein [Bacteroides sp.]|uniref:plasmid pRiA4b ORF-3 family protein n=1 Tax=Bacteroides sp. TaxID=29523 RepID=UPI0025BA714F|nr:plasmid pRiA4b ORF-3 family protein [Bacteroides sp.]